MRRLIIIIFSLVSTFSFPVFDNARVSGDEGTRGWDNVRPAWMPDGKSLVFGSNRDGNWEIYVMDADGSNQRNLTHSPHGELFP